MSTVQTDILSARAEIRHEPHEEVRPRAITSVLRRFLVTVVIFFGTGEAMLRFDARTLFFSNQVHLTNDAKQSAELAATSTGDLGQFERSFRVVILGDSYLYGAGIRPDGTVAARLRQYFNAHPMPGFPNTAVLDLTRPGANTYMNVTGFLEYAPRFRPHAAILAYNANDVYGRQSEDRTPKESKQKLARTDGTALETTRSIRRLLFSSKLVEFMLTKINMELKHAGIIVPGTEFEHQVRQSHNARYPGWIASQEHLRQLAAYCREHGIFLQVANMPDLSMLDNYKLYTSVDQTIAEFFRLANIQFVNVADPFLAKRGEKYAISRYDGHPNERAHEIIAEHLFRELINSYPRTVAGGGSSTKH